MTINTVEKGDDFEEKALSIIEKIIEEGQLGLLKDQVKVYKKHKYYSEIRNGDITVDLAIEVRTPGASKPSLLYIVECKNYNTRVPVTKLEAFVNQLQQLKAHKGIFISNSPLQKGAYNIANNHNIMFIQGETSDNFDIILHKTNREKITNEIPTFSQSDSIDEGIVLLEKMIDQEILDSFKKAFTSDQVSYGIERLSSEQIESLADNILDEINPQIRLEGLVLSEKEIIHYLTSNLNFKITEFSESNGKLGYCDLLEQEIGLSNTLRHRKLFVLAHELGHIILHSKLKIGQTEYDNFPDSEYSFKTGKYNLENPKHWIEWQANHFAICLLLNKYSFFNKLTAAMRRNGYTTITRIYVDDQETTWTRFNSIITQLSERFSVSKTTIVNRIDSINMLNDNRKPKRIGEIIFDTGLLI